MNETRDRPRAADESASRREPLREAATDVIVVGGGGAGLAAAIEAREGGAQVVLLEKNARLGGSTAWSIGSVTSTGTPHQRRKGIVDSTQAHWEDMPGFAGDLDARDNPALRRILCDEIPVTFAWLLECGVRFMGPMPEPPHRLPRMHNVLPNSRAFIYHLERRARRVGVEVRVDAPVRSLVFEHGRVTGVDVAGARGTERLHARRGVVLAAGDFTNDADYKARFMGERAARVGAVNPTATGDGQRMAETLGARIVNGDLALGPELRFLAPAHESLVRRLPPWAWLAGSMAWAIDHVPMRILRPFMMQFLTTALAPSLALFDAGAMLVNARGERFCNECDAPALQVPEQPGGQAWIILDAALAQRFSAWPHFISTAPGVAYAYLPDYLRNRRDVCVRAANSAALAEHLGIDAAALRRSLETGDRPLGPGPYVALGPVRAVFVHAEGGLAVDEQHRVLGTGDRPIPGLWAAGATGQGGLLLKGHGHHLAWAFVSGRRAGRLAAQSDIVPD